jgi:magnesium chelatase subunit I
VKQSNAPEKVVSAAEFLLEGMYAHKKLSRSEERGFSAQEKTPRRPERTETEPEDWQQRRQRRGGLN